MKVPSSLTVVVDSREKKPLLIPSTVRIVPPGGGKPRRVTIQTRKETLEAGDYLLAEGRERAVIERKNSLNELSVNLTVPHRRRNFLREMERFRDGFSWPILLVEGSPAELEKGVKEDVDPDVVRDLLFDITRTYGIHLQWMPFTSVVHRRATGMWVTTMLIHEFLRRDG